MGMDVGVDADDDIDHIAQIGQTVHAFSPSLDGTWFRSGTEDRQDCDETRQAPLTPGGQAPDQASYSNRAGAGNHERTGRTKAPRPVIPGVTPAVTNHSPAPSGCVGDPHSHSAAFARVDVRLREPRTTGGGPTRPASGRRFLQDPLRSGSDVRKLSVVGAWVGS